MSFLLTRPPNPVPFTSLKSTLFSRAMRRTRGDVRTSSASPFFLVLCDGGSGCAARRVPQERAGAARASALGAAASAGCGSGHGAFAIDHGHHRVDRHRLVFLHQNLRQDSGGGRGNLRINLVGGDFEQGSSRSTRSPTFFIHLVMVPSAMLSPIWGMMTFVGMIYLIGLIWKCGLVVRC